MLKMHHRLPDMQFCKVADERVRVDGAAIILTTARHTLAQQITFANQRPLAAGINKPALGGAQNNVAAISAGFIEAIEFFRRDFNPRQQFGQGFAAAFAFHRKHHRTGEGLQKLA